MAGSCPQFPFSPSPVCDLWHSDALVKSIVPFAHVLHPDPPQRYLPTGLHSLNTPPAWLNPTLRCFSHMVPYIMCQPYFPLLGPVNMKKKICTVVLLCIGTRLIIKKFFKPPFLSNRIISYNTIHLNDLI